MVSYAQVKGVVAVSGHYHHFAVTVGEERVSHPSLYVGKVPNLGRFPCFVDFGDILVHFTLSVHGVPQGLTVSRVISSAEVLLVSVVKEWDTSGSHSKSDGGLEA